MKNRIRELRQSENMTQSVLAGYLGIKQNTLSYWEQGIYDPDNESLKKLADLFDCSIDYLLGKTEQKKSLVNGDEELSDYLEELKNRSEMRMLFSVSKSCTKEEVEQAVRIIEALRKGENN